MPMKLPNPFNLRIPWAIAVCYAWLLGLAPSALALVANVSIGDNFFSPGSTNINVGDQVKWTWIGSILHSTTSNSGLWDSGTHAGGLFTFSHTFSSAGSFPYHCTIHAFMVASVTVQAVNQPPSVNITNPPNGAILSAPATFVLAATASDPQGSVTNVQFFQGTVSLGNAVNSPYSVTVNNLTAGSYTFSAVATDNSGLKATNAISLTVNALPTVGISAPTNGATFAAPWAGTIRASASDSDGSVSRVDFLANSTLLGSVTNPPTNLSLTAPSLGVGTYLLTARATDNNGGVTTSSGVTVNVVTPVAVTLSAARRLSPTTFQFAYSANTGLTYVVQRSTDLINWRSLATNQPSSNPTVFQDAGAPTQAAFYRVGLLPNP